MAQYKDAAHVTLSNAAAYDEVRNPGSITPHSGIYRCTGCGKEAVSEFNSPLPPQNHHTHPMGMPPIRWKLLVFAQHNGS